MAVGEFDLIRRYFARRTPRNSAVRLGIGDDCALLTAPEGCEWALTADTLVQGVHFLPDCPPADVAYKALAVNLSDLAAMGAEAAAFTLALTLPESDEAWLEQFSTGLFELASAYGVELCGGDTTRGPLVVVTIQAMGLVPAKRALCRSGAKSGDGIYVTGRLGEGGLGLKVAQGRWQEPAPDAVRRFHRPQPRLEAGFVLRDLASACIDVSDGLAADLEHILAASGVGAELDWEALPVGAEVAAYVAATGDWAMPLTAGDDYELCFTAPGEAEKIAQTVAAAGCDCTLVGRIRAAPGLAIRRGGHDLVLHGSGYRHF